MKNLDYTCPKCSNTTYQTGQMRATGSILSKILDIQTEKFTLVTCKKCTYTEFYKADSSSLGNIFDFFTG